MAEDSDETKEFEPTQHRLDEARQRGDIPTSQDLISTSAQIGFLLTLTALGAQSLSALGGLLARMLGDVDGLSSRFFDGGGQTLAGAIIGLVAQTILPWFLVPALCAVAAIAAQQAFTLSVEKLQLKPERINPVKNAGRKFGPEGLFEFAKSGTKLLVVSLVLGVFLAGRLDDLVQTAGQDARAGVVVLVQTLAAFLTVSVIVAAAIGVADLLWQRHSHRRRLRMSRKEMIDEHKSTEGDPHTKQQRRQRGYDIATNRMLADVPQADVVIVNPTHYAVALKWERLPGKAPICVAKGRDEIAARIRELAAAAGVPVHSDPPTARALFATLEIGGEVHPDHYRTVATAIRFAEAMRARAGARKPARAR